MSEPAENQLMVRMLQARSRAHLLQAPGMAAHVLSMVVPPKTKEAGERVSGSRELPLPLNAKALEDANDLYGQLVNWSTYWARVLGAPPPASVLVWFRKDEDCDGFPSWVTVADSRELVRDVTRWLVAAGDRIGEDSGAGMYFDSIKDLMAPLFGRYPMAPRMRATSAMTCPVCDRRTVIVNFDAEPVVMVACTFCGHEVPPAAFEKYVAKLTLQHHVEAESREYWSFEDAMRECEVSRATVLRYVREGLPTYGSGEVVKRVEFLGMKRQRGLNSASGRLAPLSTMKEN